MFANKLKILRTMDGLSMQDLADKSGLSKQAISKYENGELTPSSDAVIKLAKALNVPQDYFYNPDSSAAPKITLASVALREKEKVLVDEFELIKKDTVDYLVRHLELETLSATSPEFINPIEDIEIRSFKDVEKAAKVLRKKWKLGTVPIASVVDLLESKGIRIYEVFRSDKFEGAAAWAGKVPVIIINSTIKEMTRIRFTALHELGHILLKFFGEPSVDHIERFCDSFSGELLFPREAVVVEFGNTRTKVSVQEFKSIKEKYGISVMAIIITASKAGVIDQKTYNLWKTYYKQWYANNEDFGTYPVKEQAKAFYKMLYNCLIEDKISLGKAAMLSRTKESILKRQMQPFGQYIN